MIKNALSLLVFLLLLTTIGYSQINPNDSLNSQIGIDNIEKSLKYQTGIIEFKQNNAKLTVPKGFKYLDATQSKYVLTDLWKNPADSSILGLLVPENKGVLSANSWVFAISYQAMGYVKDEDATDINYDELLEDMKKESVEANLERQKSGYEPVTIIGWASKPFYDKDKKVLHWAKEAKFGKDEVNTLNYNLRILGKDGIFLINAIATMTEFKEVNESISSIQASIEFEKGSSYADFNPSIDKVAAFTVGGLVAGKILAKVGFFALIIKFWKIIAMAIAGGGAYLWNFLKKKKKTEEKEKNTLN